jgi:hypothetical protein
MARAKRQKFGALLTSECLELREIGALAVSQDGLSDVVFALCV